MIHPTSIVFCNKKVIHHMWPTQEVIQEILPGLFQGNWDTNSDVLSKYKIGAILNGRCKNFKSDVSDVNLSPQLHLSIILRV
jgi:hypothetical protein